MKLKIVDAPYRKAVYGHNRWSDNASSVLKETRERTVLSECEQPLPLVLKLRDLKPWGKGVKGNRFEALGESLYESIKTAPSKHSEPLDIAQSRVGSSVENAKVRG
jgi:hypothetical protein